MLRQKYVSTCRYYRETQMDYVEQQMLQRKDFARGKEAATAAKNDVQLDRSNNVIKLEFKTYIRLDTYPEFYVRVHFHSCIDIILEG